MNDAILCTTCLLLVGWVIKLKREVEALKAQVEFDSQFKGRKPDPSRSSRQSDSGGMRNFDLG